MQNLNSTYNAQPDTYAYWGRVTSPGTSFVLTAGAAPKFTVARSSAGVYVVTLQEAPVLFLGADASCEGAIANVTGGSLVSTNTVSYVYAAASGSTKATVTFYTAVQAANTAGPVATLTLTDVAFSFQIYCADTSKVA